MFATTLATALQVNEERPLNGTHVLVVKFDLSNPQTRERDCLSAKFNLTEAALLRLGSKELEKLAQSTLGKGQKKRMRERVSRWRAGTAGGNRLLLVVKLGEVAYLFEEHVVGTRLGSGPDGEPAFIKEYRRVQQELSRVSIVLRALRLPKLPSLPAC